MKLQYANKNKTELNDLKAIQAILKPHNIMLPSDYLLIMEQAEEGDYGSIIDMATLFWKGSDTVNANYELCKRYAYKSLDFIKENTANPVALLEVYTNLIYIEAEFGQYEQSKTLLKEATELVVQSFDYPNVFAYINEAFRDIVNNSEFEE